MPKRGTTQPWRVVFLWENGVKGTSTYGSHDVAQFFLDAIVSRAAQIDSRVATALVDRREDPTPIPKIYERLAATLADESGA